MIEHIPVFEPRTGIDTVKAVTDALDVGWLGMGAITKEFEDRISEFLEIVPDSRYVIATNTGTSALHLALRIAGIGHGDEVITPSFNYVADHQAIAATGAKVVMCDVLPYNLGIDVRDAESLVTSRTKAIMPLHFSGIPCAMNEVYRFAHSHNLRVIEDACHAFGTRSGGNRIGSTGDITCFSFDPVKIITSIDGGCVVVNSARERDDAQHMRLLGVDKDTILRYQNERAWEYDVVSEGYRYHLNNISAAVGVSQIKRIEGFIASRRSVCQRYSEAFNNLPELRTLSSGYTDVSPFIYVVRVYNRRREGLIQHLKDRGIATGVHFVPVHRHAFFKDCRTGSMRVTDQVVDEVLTLPLHSHMREDFVERVIDGVCSFFSGEKSR